ncbi:putative GRAM domain-containing protein 1B [Hypsibius exemplaris]|uniref:GRAM domain-containing protein 1B n=1 Tax=Hypsibius exemplaris TaxID=2072580 RepID=A0A1W0WDG0_HYPEX|nr:putative GRAM domain-containing protein 1B [Hypsibius exemplaris]
MDASPVIPRKSFERGGSPNSIPNIVVDHHNDAVSKTPPPPPSSSANVSSSIGDLTQANTDSKIESPREVREKSPSSSTSSEEQVTTTTRTTGNGSPRSSISVSTNSNSSSTPQPQQEQESQSGQTNTGSASRECSVERRSLSGSDSGYLVTPNKNSHQSSRDDSTLSLGSSTRGSADDVTCVPALPRSRTASFSNISGGSGGAASITPSGKESKKKSPAMMNTLAPNNRHNSDASIEDRQSVASSTGKSGGKGSDKKRQRWYQSLYPSYKQRSEEFKKLFPAVAENERLLIDYSCALQRDILVQGRFYISQYHICFYAKIIAWETNICTPWKSVISLSKERTAKIIPNALSYSTTDHEQYYFTSFGQRDKTFTNLYRIWQGAVKDQPMSTQEMWSFVHYQYGDDLGLSSDDDDYIQPAYLRSYPEVLAAVTGTTEEDDNRTADDLPHQGDDVDSSAVHNVAGASDLPSTNQVGDGADGVSVSSSSGSDQGDEAVYIPAPPVNGQTFIDHEFRIPFDQLFLTMFSESKLLKDMFVRRKFLETAFGQWTLDPTTDCQVRHVKYCISLGPKTIRTEERQTLLKESVTGKLHLVDSVAQNHGAPYSDSFSVVTHYVLHKIGPTNTRVRVATEVVFRKANWAVKAILEKGVMDQLRDYMADLKGRLSTFEAELATREQDGELASGRTVSFTRPGDVDFDVVASHPREAEGRSSNNSFTKLICVIALLVVLNAFLYIYVWDSAPATEPKVCGRGDPRCADATTSDWLNLVTRFSQPENAHLLRSLNDGLASVMKGLQTVSAALEELQANIVTKSHSQP